MGALATELGVALPATHRALDDARVTCHVYLALLKRARELPRHTLAELVRHGSASGWGANLPLQELLQARSSEKDDVGSMPAKRCSARQGSIASTVGQKSMIMG